MKLAERFIDLLIIIELLFLRVGVRTVCGSDRGYGVGLEEIRSALKGEFATNEY